MKKLSAVRLTIGMAGFLIALFAGSSCLAHLATAQEVTTLESGSPIVKSLKGGETHAYRVHLSAGWFLHVVVDQKGIDVVVTALAPDGHALTRVDSPNGMNGAEPLVMIADGMGDYRLEVSSPNKQAPAGRYDIRILALREARPADRDHVAAERTFAEAQQLRAQRTDASYRAAIEKYRQALAFYQSAGDRPREALTLYIIGSALWNANEFRKAIVPLSAAVSLFRSLADRAMEASTLSIMGSADGALGDMQIASEHYEQALVAARAAEDRAREGSILNNIGKIYDDQADWQKSREHYQQALLIFRDLGDQIREAIALKNIGRAWFGLTDFDKALDFYRQALALDRLTHSKANEAYTLDNIGLAYATSGRNQLALEFYTQALALWKEVGDRRGESSALNHLGAAYSALGEPQKALGYLQSSLQIIRAIEDRWREATTLGNLGDVYISLGQLQPAIDYYDQSLTIMHAVGDHQYEARMLYSIARAERERSNLAAARQQIEAAIPLFEQARSRVNSPQERAAYFAAQQGAYAFYIDLLMQMHRRDPSAGHDATAFGISERARARSLLEMLAESRADIRQGIDPTLLAREHGLIRQLNAKVERLMPLVGRRSAQEQVEALNKEIRQLESDYEQLQTDIRRNNPHYAAIVQPQPLDVKAIQQQVLDGDTMILEYALGKPRSYLWAITRDAVNGYELPGEEQITQAAQHVLNRLTARSRSVTGETPAQRRARLAAAETQLPEAARSLGAMILGPVASQLNRQRLVIVADGALQYIPFAMLPAPDSRRAEPLIVAHEIISLPSASTLAVQRRELADRQPAPRMVAVIADPVFSLSDERLKATVVNAPNNQSKAAAAATSDETARLLEHLAQDAATAPLGGMRIPRLPFTRREAEQIMAVAPPETSLQAVDFKANRAIATGGELKAYRYVHFATHGYLDSERPGLSALVLSLIDEQGKPQAGFLRADEIYNLALPAELVVLSACQTGLGKAIKGEGLVGLTRGFMYAGAARVVVSLWSVNDKATAELMAKFYERMLKQGQRPAAALRAAQVEMLRQRSWQSPYYWAAFILQGEWR
jgi:CHAT domain-containing protein